MNRVKSEGNNEAVPFTTPSAVASFIPFGTLSPANSTNSGILRSPSHESFATDLSLMSLSSLGSEIGRMRGSAFQ
ncbi:hypothetical protein CEXT_578421 [Caerostris extrusa]|uniref:Uncharacterized protein n=1 Tax=Caerostris extrusa TaxID=172846 RepID=A0AAV4W6G2_CAEEX|nr:hypothetical protein CEXT_578421 [Caerostris extrusa]